MCTTAYVEIYDTDTRGNTIWPAVSTSCGTSVPPEFTTTSQYIKIRVVVEANPRTNTTNVPDIDFVADFTSYYIGRFQNPFARSNMMKLKVVTAVYKFGGCS